MAAPPHLWWTYLLTFFALAVMGGGAGQALFSTRDLGHFAAGLPCLAGYGYTVPVFGAVVTDPFDPHFVDCEAPYNHGNGVAMMVGAVSVVVAVWLLMVCGGLIMRARLNRGARDGSSATAAAAQRAVDRFEIWCDVWQLTGRQRPRLVLVAPGRFGGRAFTTGVPLARPVVALPLGHAYLEPARFDVIVLHELAHVRSRDLLWAASVWWAGWLNVPVLLLSISSVLFGHPEAHVSRYTASLWTAAALSAAVLILRAALLRRRELAADRFAVEVLGADGPLREVLGARARTPARSGPAGLDLAQLVFRIQQLTASHPPPEQRAEAGGRRGSGDSDHWEGGFAVSAATSLIAMFTYQGVYIALADLSGSHWANPMLPTDLEFASAGLLWACVIVPAWVGRVTAAARAGRAPTWWGPVAGVVLGLVVGYLLQAPGNQPVGGVSLFPGHLALVGVVLGGLAVAGVAVFTAGLATCVAGSAVGGARRRLALVSAVLTAAVALTTALGVAVLLLVAQERWGSAAENRTLLSGAGDLRDWYGVPLLMLVGCTLVLPRPVGARWVRSLNPLPRRCLPVVAAAAGVGGVASTLSWQLRIGAAHSEDAQYLLVFGGWWICALAGWGATAVVLLTGRGRSRDVGGAGGRSLPAGVPAALNAGLVTAAIAGLVEYLTADVSGYGGTLHLLQESARRPMWILCTVVVATLPWLVGLVLLARRLRRGLLRGSLRGSPSGAARPVVIRSVGTLPIAVGTGLGVAALAGALVAGLLAPVTVSAHDRSAGLAALRAVPLERGVPQVSTAPRASAAPTGSARPTASVAPPTSAGDPGRALDHASAERVFAGLRDLLPTDRKTVPNSKHSTNTISPHRCQTLFDGDYASERSRPRSADITHTYEVPAKGVIATGMTVVFSVVSYTTAWDALAPTRLETARCPHSVWLGSGVGAGPIQVSLTARDLTGTPFPALRQDLALVSGVGSATLTDTGLYYGELVGHTLVSVQVDYIYTGARPTAAVRRFPQTLADAALSAFVKNLRAEAVR
ncbi:M48 family metalloprotease [Streptacidiphilus sp. N1-12]|uniref:M48 family metalloprotease n=2 Tax=Streptacidiphilus alkalitolerans TaxID=3342712 RepID=A0ABV6VKS2_9ACTN